MKSTKASSQKSKDKVELRSIDMAKDTNHV